MPYRASVGLVLLLLASAACGTPTSPPVAPVQSVATAPVRLPGTLPGVWRLSVSGTRCSNNACSSVPHAVLDLRVAANGSSYSALLDGTGFVMVPEVLDLTGAVGPDGAVTFTGSVPHLSDPRDVTEMRALRVRVDAAAGLVGDIDLRQHWPSTGTAWSFVGTVLSASHQPLPSGATSLAGQWTGRAMIASCEGDCRGGDRAGSERVIELVVGGLGSGTVAQLRVHLSACSSCWVPLTGTTAGSSLSLVGAAFANPVRPDDVLEVRAFSASADVFGRLTGRFTLASRERIAVSPFDTSYVQEFNITWLMRD